MKSECEDIALNIMKVLKRTGNTWRRLNWEEYVEVRLKDKATDKGGGFDASKERPVFYKVIKYTVSEESARSFGGTWKNIEAEVPEEELSK